MVVASVKGAVWKLKERRRDDGGDCDGMFHSLYCPAAAVWLELESVGQPPSIPAAAIQFRVMLCSFFVKI
jgi:hypothetical protein